MTKAKRVFYGWWIVLACSTLHFYGGGAFFYGFTAFFKPILSHFSWSYAATSLAFTFRSLEAGIASPLVGFLVDRLGPRKLLLFGTTVAGAGFILMSRMNSLLAFYVTFLVVAIGWSAGLGMAGMTAVANWFQKKVGIAMALLVVGYGASGLLVPVIVWLIANHGWRVGLFVIGIGTWAICIPLSLVVRHKPEPYGYLPDGEPQAQQDDLTETATTEREGFTAIEALRTSAFWYLSLALAAQWLATSPIFVHVIPYLESVGLSTETAGLVVTGMSLLSIIGRLGFGWLGDMFTKRKLLMVTFALQFIGLLIFANIQSAWHVIPFLIIFSPGFGGTMPLMPAIQREYFGRTAFGTIMGLMWGVTTPGGMVGPVFAGWIYDIRGSYRLALWLLSGTLILAIPMLLAIKQPTRKTKPAIASLD